jgi:hypothetical protein
MVNKDFFYLLEYSIAKGTNLQEADEDNIPDVGDSATNDGTPKLGYEKKTALGSAPKPGVPATDGPEPEDATSPLPDDEVAPGSEKPDMDGPDETEKEEDVDTDPKEEVEDILGKLVKLHADKLEAIDNYMANNDMLLGQLQQKTNEVEVVKGEMSHMKDQIKILTPPTPLESGNAMIAAAGGTRVEDYWNNWLAKNKRDERLDGNPYYPADTQDGSFSLETKDVPDLSKEDVKNSFFGKESY